MITKGTSEEQNFMGNPKNEVKQNPDGTNRSDLRPWWGERGKKQINPKTMEGKSL